MSPLFIQNLGFMEILLILGIALLVFGPQKLPEIGKSLGKSFREFKKGTSGIMDSFNQEIQNSNPSPGPTPSRPAPQIAPPINTDLNEEVVIDLESQEEEDKA